MPIIALVAKPSASVIDAAARCGVRAVVGKFDRRGLTDAVDRLLENVSASDDSIERRVMAEIAA
jgi:AmiR/NasT family two-component response regulator